jgi:hypothetical protein
MTPNDSAARTQLFRTWEAELTKRYPELTIKLDRVMFSFQDGKENERLKIEAASDSEDHRRVELSFPLSSNQNGLTKFKAELYDRGCGYRDPVRSWEWNIDRTGRVPRGPLSSDDPLERICNLLDIVYRTDQMRQRLAAAQ